ncbi:MAG TPA: GntR family transcriptional regulator [Micromonosporaceae bacterium]|nr:GntR family transcriptional regulator [Micromonosporaceae bacterium]
MVKVDPASAVPVYEQIRSQIAAKIAAERLPAGAKLPTIRQLAADLGLAVNTVAHAYRELEMSGLVETRPRHGTTVADGTGSAVKERLRAAARSYAELARTLGISPREATTIVKDAINNAVH